MAQNSLSPGYVVLDYVVAFGTALHPHTMTLPVLPADDYDPGDVPSFITNGATEVSFGDAVNGLLDVVDGFFSTSTSFPLASFWEKPTPTSDPVFIRSIVPTVTAGTGGAAVLAGQATISFRSSNGGVYKFTLMESEISTTTVDQYPFPVGDAAALDTYLTSEMGWVYARDNGQLLQAIKLVGKMNDKLRRKYILNP